MTRRRFFRVLTLTLLLLCVGAWGWSLRNRDYVGYRGTIVLLTTGHIELWYGTDSAPVPGIHFSHDAFHYPIREVLTSRHHWWFDAGRFYSFRIYVMPMWSPMLLLTALTAWAWRKRRSEGERGFAVGLDHVRGESGENTAIDH